LAARSFTKRRIATGYRHSWEWLSYSNLASYYRKRPKITFKVEQGYHNWLDVQGHPIRFHHGDAIRYAGGVGGVTIPLRKKIAQWNKRRQAYLDMGLGRPCASAARRRAVEVLASQGAQGQRA